MDAQSADGHFRARETQLATLGVGRLSRLNLATAWSLVAAEMYVLHRAAELLEARSPLLEVLLRERREVSRRVQTAATAAAARADVLRDGFEQLVPRVEGELEARAVRDCRLFAEPDGQLVRWLAFSALLREHRLVTGASYERPLAIRLSEAAHLREELKHLSRHES